MSPSSSQALLEAAETLRRALPVYERAPGADHSEVAGVLEQLAGEREREQTAAAGARALRIRRTVLGHTYRRSR